MLGGCAAKRVEPLTVANSPAAPAVQGMAVFVVPAQGVEKELAASFDRELAFFLAEQGRNWVVGERVSAAAAAAPRLGIDVTGLPLQVFMRSRVEQIGEPLFSALHSLGLLLDVRYALLPFEVVCVPGTQGGTGRVEIGVALLDTRDGDVLWQGRVAGAAVERSSPLAAASAARALATQLAR